MRWLGGTAAALVLGLTVSARAAEDGAAPSSGGHWWDKLNPFAAKKADAPQIPPTVPVPANTAAATAPAAGPTAVPRESDDEAFHRRLAVCDRLKQIAFSSDNKELEQRAEALEARAYQVYNRRMPVSASRLQSQEATLDQDVGRNSVPAATRTVNLPEDRK
jgi:hypothetical protein